MCLCKTMQIQCDILKYAYDVIRVRIVFCIEIQFHTM